MRCIEIDIGNGHSKIEHLDKNNTLIREYYYKDDCFHRDNNLPAVSNYYKGSKIKESEFYFYNDKLHRTNGPAWIKYDLDGNIISEEYYLYGEQYNEFEYLVRVSNI